MSRTMLTTLRQRRDEDVTFEGSWAIIRPAFEAIHSQQQTSLSYEQLWRIFYKLLQKDGGQELYDNVVELETAWLDGEVKTRVTEVISDIIIHINDNAITNDPRELRAAGERLLSTIKTEYNRHIISLKLMASVLHKLDIDYCDPSSLPRFAEKGTSLFRDKVMGSALPADKAQDTTILQTLTDVILSHVAMARAGEVIDSRLIKDCIDMLTYLPASDGATNDHSLYIEPFQERFLETSAAFYRAESDSMLNNVDARTYCQRVKQRLAEEQERCTSTLVTSTIPHIVKVVEDSMLREKMSLIVDMDTGVRYLVDNDKRDDLLLMYSLEARVNNRKSEMTRVLQQIIADQGAAINLAVANPGNPPITSATAIDETTEQSEMPPKTPVDKAVNQQTIAALNWIEQILALKDRCDTIWRACLNQDQIMQTALTKSVGDVINSYTRCSECISLYIDEHMKKGLKGKSEAEIDAVLEKAITLLRYLQDKDMFEKYYKKHLCKRLLMGRSLSIDVETAMIGRMKIELGNSFTFKLEAMFKDMTLSEDLTAGYKKRMLALGDRDARAIDLSINVLTSMTWPLETMRNSDDDRDDRIKVIFPPAVEALRSSFVQFYGQRHSGRVLTWQANMGTADVKATFPKVATKDGLKTRTHELNVSTYAMIVLALFNAVPEGESLGFEEIQERTRIPERELMRNLQSLAVAPKTRVLLKQPMSKDVKLTDRFIFNEGFQGKFVKIKIGVVTAGNKVETDRERKDTEAANNDSRGFVIEAAIVRIMK